LSSPHTAAAVCTFSPLTLHRDASFAYLQGGACGVPACRTFGRYLPALYLPAWLKTCLQHSCLCRGLGWLVRLTLLPSSPAACHIPLPVAGHAVGWFIIVGSRNAPGHSLLLQPAAASTNASLLPVLPLLPSLAGFIPTCMVALGCRGHHLLIHTLPLFTPPRCCPDRTVLDGRFCGGLQDTYIIHLPAAFPLPYGAYSVACSPPACLLTCWTAWLPETFATFMHSLPFDHPCCFACHYILPATGRTQHLFLFYAPRRCNARRHYRQRA